jgi:hypothetical protein
MLDQVLVDQLGERQRSRQPLLSAQPLERTLERLARVLRGGESALLYSFRATAGNATAIGSQRLPVFRPRLELEDLAVLQHHRSLLSTRGIVGPVVGYARCASLTGDRQTHPCQR